MVKGLGVQVTDKSETVPATGLTVEPLTEQVLPALLAVRYHWVAIACREAEAGGAGDGIARSGGAAVGAEDGACVVSPTERISDGRTGDGHAGDIAGDGVGDSGAADYTGVTGLAGGDGDIGVAVSVIESNAGGR